MRYLTRWAAALLTSRLLILLGGCGAGELSPEAAAGIEAWIASTLELLIDLAAGGLLRWFQGRAADQPPPASGPERGA